MSKIAMTQIMGISFIFIVVAIIAIMNVIKINYYSNKAEKVKENDSVTPSLYEVKKRDKS